MIHRYKGIPRMTNTEKTKLSIRLRKAFLPLVTAATVLISGGVAIFGGAEAAGAAVAGNNDHTTSQNNDHQAPNTGEGLDQEQTTTSCPETSVPESTTTSTEAPTTTSSVPSSSSSVPESTTTTTPTTTETSTTTIADTTTTTQPTVLIPPIVIEQTPPAPPALAVTGSPLTEGIIIAGCGAIALGSIPLLNEKMRKAQQNGKNPDRARVPRQPVNPGSIGEVVDSAITINAPEGRAAISLGPIGSTFRSAGLY